jgi:hypothetical protein
LLLFFLLLPIGAFASDVPTAAQTAPKSPLPAPPVSLNEKKMRDVIENFHKNRDAKAFADLLTQAENGDQKAQVYIGTIYDQQKHDYTEAEK